MYEGVRVSAIVTLFNAESRLGDLFSTLTDLSEVVSEFIIVNDASIDLTEILLKEQAQIYSGNSIMKIVNLPKNLGVSGARNYGIALSNGNVIVLLDDDDTSLPERIDEHVRGLLPFLGSPAIHFVSSTKFYSNGYELFCPAPSGLERATDREIARFLLLGEGQSRDGKFFAFPGSAMAFTRETASIVGGFDTRFRRSEDADFVLRAVKCHAPVLGTHLSLIRRGSDIGSSQSSNSSIKYERMLLEIHGPHYISARERRFVNLWLKMRNYWFERKYSHLLPLTIFALISFPIRLFKKFSTSVIWRLRHECLARRK